MTADRRRFLQTLTALSGALCLPETLAAAPARPAVACNQYNWITFYQREGKQWMQDPDASLSDFVQSGLKGYEPSFNKAEEVRKLAPLLQKYGLEMHSVYVGSTLHRADESQQSMETLLAIAEAAKPLGTRIIVSNPSPIKWGSGENKNDSELERQARNLDQVGAELRKRGMTLAYHTHDPELRAAAREFHHMLLATDPKNVALCLDAHWIYRGAGNSQVALFDIVKLYGKRIVELHLRQSQNGVWSEVFGPGDIDYPRLVRELKALNVRPHLVLEQCVEKESPKTMNGVEAHRRDLAYAREIFGQ
ncbi:sugar phosphate isomerase/epimerase family protein [Tellurirhabdus rosea]|uniref:sugar phosphate isomerase/epimerase family protein n=1 Tax=Tellurirhabdus rosea TaxID=2674997 RepID=UPI00225874D1|nr:TIM barrel protein [Tellurirhabdus rosea]